MDTKNKANMVYLLTFLFVFSFSNLATGKLDDKEKLKELEERLEIINKSINDFQTILRETEKPGVYILCNDEIGIEHCYTISETELYALIGSEVLTGELTQKEADHLLQNYIPALSENNHFTIINRLDDLRDTRKILESETNRLENQLKSKKEKTGYSSPEGTWAKNTNTHKGCTDKSDFCKPHIDIPITFKLLPDGNMEAKYSTLVLKGPLNGLKFEFTYSGYGWGDFTFGSDFKSFKGKYEDQNGHKGPWNGTRE
jgi:hypothetical protein